MGLLADTLRSRLAQFMQAHNPTRILVGGLPGFIIDQIAASWCAPYDLLLVSPGTSTLPANVHRCRADDLTAERQHVWAALVSPLESRGIQESIRSSAAATVRELWSPGFPWHPCELPGARWADIRMEFIDRIGLTSIRKQVAACLDQFREELRGEVDAGIRFFSALDTLVTAPLTYDDVSFQLGFPKHPAGSNFRKRTDRESVLVLLDQFVEKFKEEVVDDALDHFLDLARTHYTDPAVIAQIEAALKFFANEFRHLSPADADNPVRAWRSIFSGNRNSWEVLCTDTLADLLLPDGQRPTFADLTLSSGQGIQLNQIGDNTIILRDRNVQAPSITADFLFNQTLADQAAQAAAGGTTWRLFARVNRNYTRLADPIPPGTGPHSYQVPLPNEGKQIIRFSAGPSTSDEKAASKAITLWECCQEFPLLIASAHAKLRPGKRKRSKDEQGATKLEIEQEITLPAQGRTTLHGYICGLHGALTAVMPGESASRQVTGLSQVPNSRCQQFLLNVEVVEGSEITFSWSDPNGTPHRATVVFDFKGEAGPRDDSLSGVLLRAHGGASAREIKDHLAAVREGHPVAPAELAVKETPKTIAIWETYQQDPTGGWWPMLVSDGADLRDQRLAPFPSGSFFASSHLVLNEQANAWRSATDPAHTIEPPPLQILAYANARSKVLAALAQQFRLAPGETIDEVNIARKAVIGWVPEELLADYLAAYTALLNAARQPTFPAGWRWHPWCLDSILLFTPNATAPTSHLLGPFHPVTLARLFFVQRCLGQRLLDDEPSPLAHIFAQAQPLAVGHVLDAQLQPSKAIAFPTGELHWLWLYRQQSQSNLPETPLVEWLRQAGLDPQTGPLSVDAEVLPQTLKQYILAYPTHQALRLSVEDCSQRTLEVLRDELLPQEGSEPDQDRLRTRLPGGVAVYDPITQVKRVDGQLLSYDPDLPLRWHHGKPPTTLPIDIATLPRSSRVDFQSKSGGGVCSSSVPTARRGLVAFSSAGLEVASALDRAVTPVGLATTLIQLISMFEPAGQQLSWGTSLSMTASPKANWTLCSASQVDPRLFIEYVKRNTGTALWTYRLFSLSQNRTPEFGRGHFLVARVSPSLATALQTLLTGIGLTVAPNDLLSELAQGGLTLGDNSSAPGERPRVP